MRLLAILLCLLPSWVAGTYLKPWLTPIYEIQTKITYFYQTYKSLQSPEGNFSYHAHDQFLTLSGSIPTDVYSVEVELTAAHTHRQRDRLDNFRVTGRYLLLDDVGGDDPISAIVGLRLTEASPCSLRDPSSFHHGRWEAELHLSFGKEIPCYEFWAERWWGLVAIGVAEKGSPWLRGDLHWEKNWWDRHQVGVFVHTLWGLGGNNISLHERFRGYASLNHQSVDIGVKYSTLFECGLEGTIYYAYRVHAKNFPQHDNMWKASLRYPIGL